MRLPMTFATAAGILAAVLFSGCYSLRQGSSYLALLATAKPVSRLLADQSLPPARRAFLERVERVRAFAVTELGLKDTKNYTSLIETESDRTATVVQACAELSFNRYLWTYPVVGKLPYKGFFNPADAEKERNRLTASGYDVVVRGVDSFSTLGWFRDPLFSFMERYGEAELAELIIHEMTHATAFSKAAGSFNEEFATFVGRRGAEEWLRKRHGTDSPELASLRAMRTDAERFAAFLTATARELAAVYGSDCDDGRKRRDKARVIAERAVLYATVASDFSSTGYRTFPMEKINNAFIDLYSLYEGEPKLYEDYLRIACSGDLRLFISDAAEAARTASDPKETLRARLVETEKERKDGNQRAGR